MALFRTRLAAVAFSGLALALTLSACSSSDAVDPVDTAGPSGSPLASEGTTPAVDEELRALVPQDVLDKGTLSVGTMYNYPPTVYVDDGERPVGIAVEIGDAIGAVLGLELEWQDMAWPGVVPGLQGGNIDISLGGIADNPTRHDIIDVVDLMKNESVFLTLAGNPDGVGGVEDVCGMSIGAVAGSTQVYRLDTASEECVANGEEPIEVLEYSANSDGITQLQSGRISAYMGPYLVMKDTARNAGDGSVFEVGDALYPDSPWAIGMQKDRGQLAEAIQGALVSLVEDGTYQAILDDYDSGAAALSVEQVLVNGNTEGNTIFAQ